MIYHYIKVALRNLLKYKGQTFISILGLAVGLFCFSLCNYLVRHWISEDDGFRNKSRIAEIVLETNNNYLISGTPSYIGPELREKQIGLIERITVASYAHLEDFQVEISEGKELPYEVYTLETDTNFLSVFGIPLTQGNLPLINKQPNTILLTESATKRLFKDKMPIGNKVTGKDGIVYTIGGVIGDLPKNNSLSARPIEALTLSVLDGQLAKREKFHTGNDTYALLIPGFKVADLEAQLRILDCKTMLFDKDPNPIKAYSFGKKKYLNSGYLILYGFIFFIGLLVLLSSLLNYFSFLTGSFFNRMKEFSIRKEIGGGRTQLFCLLLTEMLLSLLVAGIIALCLSEVFIPGFQFSLYKLQIDFDLYVLSLHILEYLLISAGIAILICWLISLRIDRKSLQEGINFSRHRVRNTLLGIQFFISLLFLSGAAIAIFQSKEGEKQFLNTLSSEEKERVFFVKTDYSCIADQQEIFLSKLKATSMIEDILRVQNKLTDASITTYGWDKEPGKSHGSVLFVSENIDSFLRLKPAIGTLALSPHTVLINKELSAEMNDNPVGRAMSFGADPNEYQIQGVLSSVLFYVGSSGSTRSLVIRHLEKGGNCYIKVQAGKEEAGRKIIVEALKEILPASIQPQVTTLKTECDSSQAMERMMSQIFSFFAIICLIITLLGTYSAISLDTERRRKEVAIRKVNGASLKTLIFLFAKMYIRLLLVAALFAFPLVWIGANALLNSWIVRFNFSNPCLWIGLLAIIAFITGLTILSRILQITRVNPAEVIKSE